MAGSPAAVVVRGAVQPVDRWNRVATLPKTAVVWEMFQPAN